jgi:hypothetical protein
MEHLARSSTLPLHYLQAHLVWSLFVERLLAKPQFFARETRVATTP